MYKLLILFNIKHDVMTTNVEKLKSHELDSLEQ